MKIETKKITGFSILLALVIVLQLVSNYISFGQVSISLALIPIVIGAILYGPLCGAFLGLATGILVLIAPSTIAIFFSISPIGTIITCLFKTSFGGFVVGIVYKLFEKVKRAKIGILISSMLMPILNTGIFFIFALIFFRSIAENATDGNIIAYFFTAFIGPNFAIEFTVLTILSSGIASIVNYYNLKHKKGE